MDIEDGDEELGNDKEEKNQLTVNESRAFEDQVEIKDKDKDEEKELTFLGQILDTI